MVGTTGSNQTAYARSSATPFSFNSSTGTLTIPGAIVAGFAAATSGSYFGKVPFTGSDGVMEIGRYIDFHSTGADTTDYTFRFDNSSNGLLVCSGTVSIPTIQSNTTSPPTINNSAGTQIGTFCRAWVNFNGTGTVAIRASFNVSSITDNGGTGDYTINFSTAMPDANYALTGVAMQSTAADRNVTTGAAFSQLTTSIRIGTRGGGITQDADNIYASIFR